MSLFEPENIYEFLLFSNYEPFLSHPENYELQMSFSFWLKNQNEPKLINGSLLAGSFAHPYCECRVVDYPPEIF